MSNKPWYQPAREWDARFNVPDDAALQKLLTNIRAQCDLGKFRYVLVSGVEVGTKAYQTDYQKKHVHCAFVFNNPVTMSSIMKNLQVEHAYYLKQRDKLQSYLGWITHHKKLETKVDPEKLHLLEFGDCPKDQGETAYVVRSTKEKQSKTDRNLIDIRDRLEKGETRKTIFNDYPSLMTRYGENIKSQISQSNRIKSNGHPHIWLWGGSGTGKSSIFQVVYPNYFLKSLETRFMDTFDPDEHSHVLLSDVDISTMKKFGVAHFITICDRGGYTVDRKHKAVTRETLCILITSQFTIETCMPEDMDRRRENLEALKRRYYEIHISEFLRLLGVKMVCPYDIKRLERKNNHDPRELFYSWNYSINQPTGLPLKSAEEYQQMVKDAVYGKKEISVVTSSESTSLQEEKSLAANNQEKENLGKRDILDEYIASLTEEGIAKMSRKRLRRE